MEENQNIENVSMPQDEAISNQELIDIPRKIDSDNESMLQSFCKADRKYEIVKVRADIDSSMKSAMKNAFICGIGTLAFMSFAQVAAQKLGMPTVFQSMRDIQDYFINGGGFVKASIENLQSYIRVVFGPLNEWLTLDNLKNFISEVGPIGNLAGLLAIFSGKNVLKNLKEWNTKNSELNIMRETMPADVANTKSAMAEFNLKLTIEALRNQSGQIFNNISNIFKRKKLEINEQISEPKAIAGFNRESINGLPNELEYDSTDLSNDTHIGRSK